jgi:hypothetical protein
MATYLSQQCDMPEYSAVVYCQFICALAMLANKLKTNTAIETLTRIVKTESPVDTFSIPLLYAFTM